jgi:Regulator of Chromosome Condensation (RCC1) repeat protein
MTRVLWDGDGTVRRALRVIVRDPQLGTQALSQPHVMTNLLKDLLPDQPRESALLIASAQVGLPEALQTHLDEGLDLGTASRLTAGWFAKQMPFTRDACAWLVSEIAVALGIDPSVLSEATLPDNTMPYSVTIDDSEDDPDVGVVLAWGDNDEGETTVPGGIVTALAVSAGWYHSLALTGERRVVAWGSSARGLTSVPVELTDVTAVSAGQYHSLALTAAGMICAWGGNGYGQSTIPSGLGEVTAISAGADHSLAVAEGKVVAWGGDRYGQTSVPPDLPPITKVAAGGGHSLALADDGTVFAWGLDDFGEAVVPDDLADVIAISAGVNQSAALVADGTVVTWGKVEPVPDGLADVVAISGSGTHHLALTSDGQVVAWGTNDCGECDVPTLLTGVTAIAAGFGHSLAVAPD